MTRPRNTHVSLTRRPPLGAAELERLRELLLDPNLLGYGFGGRYTAGEWLPGRFLSFYVREKFAPAEIRARGRHVQTLPRTLGPYTTDVLPIGDMQAAYLDHNDRFASPHTRATATLLANTKKGPLALLAGHVALPRGPKELMFRLRDPPGGSIEATDLASGTRYSGTVIDGAFGEDREVDWAVARLDIPGAQIDAMHRAVQRSPPLPGAPSTYKAGTVVHYRSPARGGALIHGVLAQHSPQLRIVVDGAYPRCSYRNLLLVRPHGAVPFSVRGDSGALVFDDKDRVVGMIVAGSSGLSVSAISTLHSLVHDPAFAPLAPVFFK